MKLHNNKELLQDTILATALIFQKPQETWEQLSSEYNGNFKDLVTGELPVEGELIETLNKIADRLIKIKWQIK